MWYRKAADQGYAAAQASLAKLYVTGRGVPQDYAQAMAWFRKAADQGDRPARPASANLRQRPRRDARLRAGDDMVSQGRRQELSVAFNNVGYLYDNGLGVPEDFAQAMSWYRKAADQNYAVAQTNIGSFDEHGRGSRRTIAQAAEWLSQGRRPGQCAARTTSASCTPKAAEWRRTTPRR